MLVKLNVFFIFNLFMSFSRGAIVAAPGESNINVNATFDNDKLKVPNDTSQITTQTERTLILLKPDAVRRKLVGKIIERFENKGFSLVGMKLVLASKQTIDQHYSQHIQAIFHDKLMGYMTSGPVVAIILEGPNAVQISRNMLGYYQPQFAQPGTIRGDFSLDTTVNVIHASDSIETANREIQLWFQEYEILA